MRMPAPRSRGIVFALLLLLAGTAGAQQGGLTPYQLAHLQSVGQAVLSPEGDRIAFTRFVPRDPFDANEAPWTELYVVDLEDGEERAFITGNNSLGSIAWTPDGEGISFLARRGDDEATALYVIPATGGEARRVLSHEESILAYDWSETGGVAFVARAARQDPAPGFPYQVEVYEELGRDRHVFVADPEHPEADPRRLDVDGSVYQALWGPDGRRLALSVAPSPWTDDFYMEQRVRIVDAATGETLASVANPGV